MNYLKACEEAYLFCKVPYEDINGKKILQVNEKYYASDHGLREALTGCNQSDIRLVLENIVFMELLRRDYNVTDDRADGHEIDFVCDRQNERRYYQVEYLLSEPSTVEREFGAYHDIRDHYPKHVLSMDTFDMSHDGIVHQNIIDFLLDLSCPK